MIYHARVFRPSAFILTMSVGCLHFAMAARQELMALMTTHYRKPVLSICTKDTD